MSAGLVLLLSLAGYVGLLLWGMQLLRTALLRSFGVELRRLLSQGLRNRAAAFGAGLGVTTLLQSSTATGLMLTSFAAEGLVALPTALAAMLGANVGTTLIVQLAAFDLSWLAPFFFLAGWLAIRHGRDERRRDLGLIAIGLGLMLLALELLVRTVQPVETAPALKALMAAVSNQPLLAAALGALLAWVSHSSVAMVLLIMSLATGGVLSLEGGIALVVGANIGSAVNPVLEGASGGNPADRRLPLGNLFNRLVGAAIVLPLAGPLALALHRLYPDPGREVANFHLLFNVVLALSFLGLVGPWARALERLLPDRRPQADPVRPRYLDPAALGTPALALANAVRESQRLAAMVETMLAQARQAILQGQGGRHAELAAEAAALETLAVHIADYLGHIGREALDRESSTRQVELVHFVVNLRNAAEVLATSFADLGARRAQSGLALTPALAEELAGLFDRLGEALALAVAVLVDQDAPAARRLIAEKGRLRDQELQLSERLFDRLGAEGGENLQLAAYRLDVTRQAKRLTGHFASVAYSLLNASGELLPSRIRG